MAFWDRWRKQHNPGGRDSDEPAAPSAPAVATAAEAIRIGERLLAQGNPEAALAAFQNCIDQQDAGVAGHVGEARAYDALGRTQDALDSLEIALAIDPCDVQALQLAGRLRGECGEHEAALDLLQRAIDAKPRLASAFTDYGLVLNACGRPEEAAQAYENAIGIDPADPAPRINLGLLRLQHFGDFEAAELSFRDALSASPGHVAAIANLGLALHAQGRLDAALAVYREGLESHPGHVELRWNRGLAHLSLGRFGEGWVDYAMRQERPGRRRIDALPYALWEGQPLPGGRLLVLAEQGLGDEIMFASCLRDVVDRVPGVVLECNPRLRALFARSFPDVEVIDRTGGDADRPAASSGRIDAMILAGSLPALFRPDAASFPEHRGYLRADPAQVEFWRSRLARLGPGPRVGLSWRGGIAHTRRTLRSLPLAAFSQLFALPDVHWVSLQYGESEAEIAALKRDSGQIVHHWSEAIADYDETAALTMACDVVVTVTTSLVHLAGALGVPALVLVPSFAEWRYLAQGDRMPWYPSIRMLRQTREGEWSDVLLQACGEVAAVTARTRASGLRND